jgi:hypothetical protein
MSARFIFAVVDMKPSALGCGALEGSLSRGRGGGTTGILGFEGMVPMIQRVPSSSCAVWTGRAMGSARSLSWVFAVAFVQLVGGCGATSNVAAEPRKPAGDAGEPLVRGDLEKDEDLARAIREHYTKYEHRIPMRDGAKLFTAVYVPKDRSRTYPIMMTRTPYGVGPYGVDNYPSAQNGRTLRRFAPSAGFVRDGYIIVHQDVRGRMMSEGAFVDVRPIGKKGEIDESTDAWDTVDWLVKNVPGNNGRVGVWGISYPGFYAAQAAVNAHPAVKAVSPQAPVTDWFVGDDFHHNGAFFLADSFDFYGSFGRPRPKPTKKAKWERDHDAADVYDFFLGMGPLANAKSKFEVEIPFWDELTSHATLDDFWKARNPRPHYRDAKPAIMTVGGWFDAEDLFGALATYRAWEGQSPKSAENVLVMGPWRHGGWARGDGDRLGDVSFGQKTSQWYRDNVEYPFFARHLKGKAYAPPAEATVFETGTNTWQRYTTWPPPDAKPATLFFHAGGKLTTAAPTAASEGDRPFDEYVSDPNKPVPYRARLGPEVDADYMTDDQRFAARRPDVVTFQTPELDEDVTIAGPIEASLWVTTTGTDADFVVKLVDVYPQDVADPVPNPSSVTLGGYMQLVRGDVFRGKFRTSFERPEPFKPNEPTLVRFTIPDTCHAFRSGHRIMVQVQSSWFPLVDRNPQTFVDIYKAEEKDFKVATHRVLHTSDKPSSLKIMVRGALPRP